MPGQMKNKIAVIGAGPAGVAIVGCLLDSGLVQKIIWVDQAFDAGRLSRYTNIPSNTKAGLFTKFALECRSFQRVWEYLEATDQSNKHALFRLSQCDPNLGCQLEYAVDMIRDLTRGLIACFPEKIVKVCSTVDKLVFLDQHWKVFMASHTELSVETIFLATGSRPKTFVSPSKQLTLPNIISLDDALDPKILGSMLQARENIATIGSSHSAILILKNLIELRDQFSLSIHNFYQSPLKYAIYLPDDRIQYDNTGLKGVAAQWARANLQDCKPGQNHIELYKGALHRYQIAAQDKVAIYSKVLPSCTKLVAAIGYERNTLPSIVYKGQPLVDMHISHSCEQSGQLMYKQTERIPGLFGFGIAFPEAVLDPVDGTPEEAVGLWKFMRHIKKSIPMIMEQNPNIV